MKPVLTSNEIDALIDNQDLVKTEETIPPENFSIITRQEVYNYIKPLKNNKTNQVPISQELMQSLDLEIRERDLVYSHELHKIENLLLIDLRSPDEFHSGKIPGSVNLDFTEALCLPEKYINDRNIVLYCSNGKLSLKTFLAAKLLNRQTFRILMGGYALWLISG